jgi:hypothetical protein
MIAGVIGGNVAGWVSDIFFQSRRGPAAAGLYVFMSFCAIAMVFVLSPPTNEVGWADASSGLQAGDRVVSIANKEVQGWADVRPAIACWPAACQGSTWNQEACMCSTKAGQASAPPRQNPTIPARVIRAGEQIDIALPDPSPSQRAGDQRRLKARPVLPLNPFFLGVIVFLISLCVIGSHGVLSGTATMDFGGRKAAGTAVGMIDGFVYLGTAVQSVSLGFLTERNWAYWPPFLVPFALIGTVLCFRIWNAKPKAAAPPQPAGQASGAQDPPRAAAGGG